MSNIHYCDYKIKYRSKLETLVTHHSYKIHIPRDKPVPGDSNDDFFSYIVASV